MAWALQDSFGAGELSPSMLGLVTNETYASGVPSLKNAVITRFGGIFKRWGTDYIGETEDSTEPARLIPLTLENDDSYMLEFTSGTLRAWTSAGTVVQYSAADWSTTTTYAASELAELQYSQVGDKLFITHKTHQPAVVWANPPDDADFAGEPFEFADYNPQYGPKLEIVTKSTTITKFNEDTGTGTRYDASAPIFDGANHTGDIFVVRDSAFRVEAVNSATQVTTFSFDYNRLGASDGDTEWMGPFVEGANAATSGSSITTPAAGAISSGDFITITDASFFDADDVGKIYGLNDTDLYVWIREVNGFNEASGFVLHNGGSLTGGTSYTTITPYALRDLDYPYRPLIAFNNVSTSGTLQSDSDFFDTNMDAVGSNAGMKLYIHNGELTISSFTDSQESDYTVARGADNTLPTIFWSKGWSTSSGYPKTVALHQDRLMFAGVPEFPDTMYGSRTGLHFDHRTGANDSDAIVLPMAETSGENGIRAMASTGTDLLLFTEQGEYKLTGAPITPSSYSFEPQAGYGGKEVQPLYVDKSVFYVEQGGTAIRGIDFQFQDQRYRSFDVTNQASHLFETNEVQEMAYFKNPEQLIFAVMSDNTLNVLTRNADTGISGWSPWSGLTVHSAARLGGTTGSAEIWLCVEREVNSVTTHYIERVQSTNVKGLDSQVTVTGNASQTVAGFDSLEGETVQVVGDGSYLGTFTVASGNITLNSIPSTVVAGLAVTFTLIPQQLEDGGGSAGKEKRCNNVLILFNDSLGGTIDDGENETDLLPFTVGTSPSTTTGWIESTGLCLVGRDNYTENLLPTISHATPHSFEILAVNMDVIVNRKEGF